MTRRGGKRVRFEIGGPEGLPAARVPSAGMALLPACATPVPLTHRAEGRLAGWARN